MTSNAPKLYQTVVTDTGEKHIEGLPNNKNWVDFALNRFHDCDELFGYIDATTQITNYLEQVISSSNHQTIEEFQADLKAFCEDRRSFVSSVKSIPSPGDFWH